MITFFMLQIGSTVLPICSMKNVMEAPRIFEDLHKYTNHHVATISYPKRTKPEYGAFKRSYPDSQATIPLFPSQDTHICLKQAFFKQMGGTSAHVYEGVTQGKKLAVELNCLRWGGALFTILLHHLVLSLHSVFPNFVSLAPDLLSLRMAATICSSLRSSLKVGLLLNILMTILQSQAAFQTLAVQKLLDFWHSVNMFSGNKPIDRSIFLTSKVGYVIFSSYSN
jgi:hypothetical protein